MAEYIVSGPATWWRHLSRRSPLRLFGPEEAAREIEVRLGPREGSRWRLRTSNAAPQSGIAVLSAFSASGIDDTLVLRLVPEGPDWKLHDLRTLAELDRKAPAARPETVVSPTILLRREYLGLGILGYLLAAAFLVAAVLGRFNRLRTGVLAVVGVSLVGVSRIPFRHALREDAALVLQRTQAPRFREPLGHLLGFRKRLESPESVPLASLVGEIRSGQPGAAVARLWLAQRAMREQALSQAKDLVREASSGGETVAGAVLRARLAVIEKKDVDAALAYEKAASINPVQDGISLEAIEALSILGFEAQAKVHVEKLSSLGTRSAEGRYAAVRLAAKEKSSEAAEAEFLEAWKLRPLSRRRLFGQGDLWDLFGREAIHSVMRLESESEPMVDVVPAALPLRFPPGTRGRRCGAYLRASIGESELQVPGGAAFAPADFQLEDAGAEEREEEANALGSVQAFLDRPAPPAGALAQPGFRRRFESMVSALARRHRWRDVAALTAGLSGSNEHVPTNLLLIRAEALRRTARAELAKALLNELSENPALLRRKDAFAFYGLGEMFAAVKDYERAIAMIRRAVAQRRTLTFLDDRIRQLGMEQRLAASYRQTTTSHFELYAPPDLHSNFPAEAGRILEAERDRLDKLIQAPGGLPIKVQLLWYEDFQETFAGSEEILGLYDGTIRVPLAGVRRFVPLAVAIMTHELAHALIASATDDRAPRWFHEGLAQHLEMRRYRSNSIPGYLQRGTFLALPALEATLETFPSFPMVEVAYHEADWMIRFIETRFGKVAIQRFIAEFRRGASTEEALLSVLSLTPVEFGERFRDWARTEAPKMLTSTVVRYDTAPDLFGRKQELAAQESPQDAPRRKPVKVPDSLKTSPLHHPN